MVVEFFGVVLGGCRSFRLLVTTDLVTEDEIEGLLDPRNKCPVTEKKL